MIRELYVIKIKLYINFENKILKDISFQTYFLREKSSNPREHRGLRNYIIITSVLNRCIKAGGGLLCTRFVQRESIQDSRGTSRNIWTRCFVIDDRIVAARCIRLPMLNAAAYAEVRSNVITCYKMFARELRYSSIQFSYLQTRTCKRI